MEVEGNITVKNAPKKGLIKDMSIALAENDITFFTEQLTDNAIWEIVGNQTIKGVESIRTGVASLHQGTTTVLHLDNIITHGNIGSANGHYIQNNKKIAFCNIFQFGSFRKQAKVKKITSYFIYT